MTGRNERVALTALQRAYLAGRSAELPLGGRAMREFRAYDGLSDASRVRGVVDAVVARHEALRLHIDPDRAQQWVGDAPAVALREIDLTLVSPVEQARRLHSVRQAMLGPETSDRAPVEVAIVDRGDGVSVLLSVDSLIIDGAGVNRVLADAAALYAAAPGAEPDLPPIESDLIGELRNVPSETSTDREYWSARAETLGPVPSLPWSAPLASIDRSPYSRVGITIDGSTRNAARAAGSQRKLFENTVVFAAVTESLRRWSGGTGFRIGVPIGSTGAAGRPVGPFSDFVIVDVPDGPTFGERSRGLQRSVLAALSHRTVSGTTVARQVLAADRTAAVVCPVTFTNGLSWPASPDLPGERIRLSEHLTATPQVALDLRVSVADSGGLYLHADFATDAISETVVRGVLRTAADLLEAMADEATWSRGEPVDIDQSVLTSPDTAPPYRDEIRTMLWRNLFQDPPAGVAIVCGGRRIDYPTLAHMVTDAMSVLRADGVRAGDRVTVEMGKGVEQIVTVLACLLMRAVYIPLDPTAPERRREAIVAAVRPRRRVTEGLTGGREGAPTIRFEPSAADDAQYILFTSGSTGAPKGVVVRRDSVEAMMRSSLDRWRIGADDVLFGVSALHHDMSVVDSLAPFQVGATLVLPTHEQRRDAVAWAEAVAAERVTVWISVPAMMDMLLHCAAAGQLGTLRRAVLGGDWVTGELVDRLRTAAPDCGITSVGGPTETTVWNIWHDVVPQGPGPVPYGSPLPGNAYQVVDDHGRPVPPGVVGRMRCTGIAVADGYLVAGDAVPPGFGTTVGADGLAQRSFLTSDIGRYRPDGVIEFLGRADGFVKVRGVRIEPGEVEKELLSHSAVARAVVSAVRADPADSFGETALGCLYVAANGSDPAELRAHLERRLPSSHVPTVWRRVDDVPLTPNGKPDRDSVEHILRTSVEGADTDPLVWLTAAALNRVRPDDEVPVDAATEIPMHWLARGGLAAVVRQMSELTGGVPVDPAALAGADTVGGVVAALRSGPSASELVAAAELAREIEQLTDDEVDARLG